MPTRSISIAMGRAAPAGDEFIPATIATETPVDRGGFFEVLDCSPTGPDLSRAPLPVLVSHDSRTLAVGIAEAVRIEGGRVRADIRFGGSRAAQEVLADVRAGIHRALSVGYKLLDKGRVVAKDTLKFRWQPLEVSIVPVPADASAGFFRSKGKIMNDEVSTIPEDDEQRPSRTQRRRLREAEAESVREAERDARAELARLREVRSLGTAYASFGAGPLAERAEADSSITPAMLREQILGLWRARAQPPLDPRPAEAAPWGDGLRLEVPHAGRLPGFDGDDGAERAYRAGMWLRAMVAGDAQAGRWCRDHNVGAMRAYGESANSTGGHLVPVELSSAVLSVTEEYSVFRQEARVFPMGSDQLVIPKALDGLSATYVSENSLISDTQTTWGAVNLSTKKLAVLVRISTELMMDSVINLAAWCAEEMGRAFGEAEDRAGFNGDGTSAFGGIRGLVPLLEDGAHAGGLVTAGTGVDTFAEVTNTDLANVMARLPARAKRGAKWIMSETAFSAIMERLVIAAGGTTVQDLANGVQRRFLGYPVVTVPGSVLPAGVSTDYSGKVMLMFGNMRLASAFGLRTGVNVRTLTETYSAYDQIGVQAISRYDIVNHDLGDATNPGAVVALVGAP